ncbi:hypothetical protein AVEN_223188-1, partial [Araneus ventricosus]
MHFTGEIVTILLNSIAVCAHSPDGEVRVPLVEKSEFPWWRSPSSPGGEVQVLLMQKSEFLCGGVSALDAAITGSRHDSEEYRMC